MAPHRDYGDQDCGLARTLEIIGERWTLLVLRDAFYGVCRFGDFVAHLGLPRAVLTDRLQALVAADVLDRVGEGRAVRYRVTAKGETLWPAVLTLMSWGSEHYSSGPNRIFRHADDGGVVTAPGNCARCGSFVGPGDLEVLPGPGLAGGRHDDDDADPVETALREPHRMLTPLP